MYKNNWEKVVRNCTRIICNILPYYSTKVNTVLQILLKFKNRSIIYNMEGIWILTKKRKIY